MWICLYSRMIYNPSGIYSVMGLLGQTAFLVLDHWGITTLSSTMVEIIYTHTNGVKCSFFSTSSPASVISRFFNDHCSNWYEMVSQSGYDLHFSNDQWWWVVFHVSWWHKCLLFKSVCSFPLPTLWSGFFFL